MNIDVQGKHYWWGDCLTCETQTIVADSDPIDPDDEDRVDRLPDCFRCGDSLAWNEGR